MAGRVRSGGGNHTKVRRTASRGETTLADVAAVAKVSPALVSSLLRGSGGRSGNGVGFSAATATRVLGVCRRLRYAPPDPMARIRLYPEEGAYAFLLCSAAADGISNPFFSRIFHGMTEALKSSAGHLAFAQFSHETDYLIVPEQLPPPARTATVTRFVLAGEPNYSLLQLLRQRGAAVVYVSQFVPVDGLVSVLADHAAAARLAVEHLSLLGHRRIAVLAPDYLRPNSYPVREFLRGLAASMRQVGLPFAASNLVCVQQVEVEVRRVFESMLASRHAPTAVLCFNDELAAMLVRVAPGYGVRVPEDLSVAGCHGNAAATDVHPFLTTISFPCIEMGRRAVHELHRMFDKPARTRPRRIILPVTLIERESTAPPRG